MDITMPQLGETVAEGTVLTWLKQPGDLLALEEPLLEVSTDKVDTEIPSPFAGILESIVVAEGETVPVGTVLATVRLSVVSATEAPASEVPAAVVPAAEVRAAAPAPHGGPVRATPMRSGERHHASPIARRLASEHGLQLTGLRASRTSGRLHKGDVTAAVRESAAPVATSSAAAPSLDSASAGRNGDRTEPLTRLRSLIGRRMVESMQTSAQLTSVVEADVTTLVSLCSRVKENFRAREGVPLTLLPFFVRAAVDALGVHPLLNASIDSTNGTVTYHRRVDLGIAVDTPRGLLVPVLRDAADLSVRGIARRIADLAARTRAGTVSADELSGATFTVTNTGSRGALFDTPIINQPQVAILGVGAVVKRAVVRDDGAGGECFATRSMAYLSLSYDHRLIDGADAGRYLTAVKQRLEAAQFDADVSA